MTQQDKDKLYDLLEQLSDEVDSNGNLAPFGQVDLENAIATIKTYLAD